MKIVLVALAFMAMTGCGPEGQVTRRTVLQGDCIQKSSGICIAYGPQRYQICVGGSCELVTQAQYNRCTIGKQYPKCRVSER